MRAEASIKKETGHKEKGQGVAALTAAHEAWKKKMQKACTDFQKKFKFGSKVTNGHVTVNVYWMHNWNMGFEGKVEGGPLCYYVYDANWREA